MPSLAALTPMDFIFNHWPVILAAAAGWFVILSYLIFRKNALTTRAKLLWLAGLLFRLASMAVLGLGITFAAAFALERSIVIHS